MVKRVDPEFDPEHGHDDQSETLFVSEITNTPQGLAAQVGSIDETVTLIGDNTINIESSPMLRAVNATLKETVYNLIDAGVDVPKEFFKALDIIKNSEVDQFITPIYFNEKVVELREEAELDTVSELDSTNLRNKAYKIELINHIVQARLLSYSSLDELLSMAETFVREVEGILDSLDSNVVDELFIEIFRNVLIQDVLDRIKRKRSKSQ